MKTVTRLVIVFAAIAGLVGSSLAASVLGVWKGHAHMNANAAPAGGGSWGGGRGGPGGGGFMQTMQKMSFILTLNKNGTYTTLVKGGPRGDMTRKGAWVLKGNQLTLNPAAGGSQWGPPRPQTLTIGKDGKSLTGTMMRGNGSIVYKR